MFHDESVGERKLSLVVVKMVIKKDGVRLIISIFNWLFLGLSLKL